MLFLHNGSESQTSCCRYTPPDFNNALYIMQYREPHPESVEGFIEDPTFSPSYDLAPALSPASKFDRRHAGRLIKRDNLLTGEEGGGGG
jgi:hypothetical protein